MMQIFDDENTPRALPFLSLAFLLPHFRTGPRAPLFRKMPYPAIMRARISANRRPPTGAMSLVS